MGLQVGDSKLSVTRTASAPRLRTINSIVASSASLLVDSDLQERLDSSASLRPSGEEVMQQESGGTFGHREGDNLKRGFDLPGSHASYQSSIRYL